MANVTVSADVDTLLQAADNAAIRAALGLDQICDAALTSAAATDAIQNGTPRNAFENATIADAGLTDADWTVDNTGKQFTWAGSETRVFHVTVALSFVCSTNTILSKFYLAKNTTVDTDTQIDRKIGTGADEGALALSGTFSLATNDDIQVYCDLASGTTFTITVNHANISIRPAD